MNKMNVIVCGGRHVSGDDYRSKVIKVLNALNADTPFNILINPGDNYGAVYMAREWAKINDIPIKTFKADFNRNHHDSGHVRNTKMLDYALYGNTNKVRVKNVLLITFIDSYKRGVKDIIRQAEEKKTIEILTIQL